MKKKGLLYLFTQGPGREKETSRRKRKALPETRKKTFLFYNGKRKNGRVAKKKKKALLEPSGLQLPHVPKMNKFVLIEKGRKKRGVLGKRERRKKG